MKMAPIWTFAAALIIATLFSIRNSPAQDTGNVIINSDPQGASVRLAGPFTISGVTPVKFGLKLSGQFRLEAVRDGYEKYRSTVYFSEGQEAQVNITLRRKTPARAFFRSMIIPGWGQSYYGHKTKSMAFALGTMASALGYLLAKDDYDGKVETYNIYKQALADTRRWSDLRHIETELRQAQREANDAETRMNALMIMAVGVYALNLIDTIVLFPEHTAYTEYKALTVVPDIKPDGAALSLAVRF